MDVSDSLVSMMVADHLYLCIEQVPHVTLQGVSHNRSAADLQSPTFNVCVVDERTPNGKPNIIASVASIEEALAVFDAELLKIGIVRR